MITTIELIKFNTVFDENNNPKTTHKKVELTEDEFNNIDHCIYLAINYLNDIDNKETIIQKDLASNLKNKLKELIK